MSQQGGAVPAEEKKKPAVIERKTDAEPSYKKAGEIAPGDKVTMTYVVQRVARDANGVELFFEDGTTLKRRFDDAVPVE